MTAKNTLFTRLAYITAVLTVGLIVFGAIVRVTDSGLGCGNDWPFCNGTIFPPLDNITAWVEWMHRLFALLIGVLGMVMLVIAVRRFRTENRLVLMTTILAAVLYVVQSLLGALTVMFDLPPTIVTLHLSTAMLLLAALLAAGIFASHKPQSLYVPDQTTGLIYTTAILSLVIIVTGALVRGSGATLACIDWPLCNGQIWPSGQGQLAIIHMIHRVAVLALGISLVLLVWFVQRDRQNRIVRQLAWYSLVGYSLQAAVGALYVWNTAAPLWGALHVGFASVTWALLVTLSLFEWLNSQSESVNQMVNETS
ncbi:MAG: heme A synthase [Anaerolineaceae bacterium]|nr:heme A synthase [Anaerolineaceae bacterium]